MLSAQLSSYNNINKRLYLKRVVTLKKAHHGDVQGGPNLFISVLVTFFNRAFQQKGFN